jgi:hypothetical protein
MSIYYWKVKILRFAAVVRIRVYILSKLALSSSMNVSARLDSSPSLRGTNYSVRMNDFLPFLMAPHL